MQYLGQVILRFAKNHTNGYSYTQIRTRDATSNDPWGPSGIQMKEIAQMTYDQNDFLEITEILDKRLNDKEKRWRHVFKSLTVVNYCLHYGSENVAVYFRDNIYVEKLKQFQYIDKDGRDRGIIIRHKAKDITNLLQDESRLREERRARTYRSIRLKYTSLQLQQKYTSFCHFHQHSQDAARANLLRQQRLFLLQQQVQQQQQEGYIRQQKLLQMQQQQSVPQQSFQAQPTGFRTNKLLAHRRKGTAIPVCVNTLAKFSSQGHVASINV